MINHSRFVPVVSFLFLLSILLNIYLLFRPTEKGGNGVKVIGVIDGDTLVLEGKSRVRLRHVDAPEKNLCGYEESQEELKRLAVGKTVRIDEQIPDQYGRGMALVYVDDTLINKELIKTGWVRYHSDNSSKRDEIKNAADTAKKEHLGIFGTCHSKENTENPRCTIKGNIDKSTDTHIYYVPGCAQYSFTVVEKDIGEQWFCTEKEAQKSGYTKAKTCK